MEGGGRAVGSLSVEGSDREVGVAGRLAWGGAKGAGVGGGSCYEGWVVEVDSGAAGGHAAFHLRAGSGVCYH